MMRPFAHTRLPARRFTTWLLLLGLLLCGGQAALAADEVGVYWDAGYTSSIANTASVPGVITGYVVLHDPSGTGGVLGWEACFDIEGPATISGWDFQGQAVNAGTYGCVAVGYVTPLPPAANILLGTFSAVATGPGPITVSMTPDYSASLPGELSYVPGNDPEALIAMTTVTGRPEVAGLNGGNPWVTLSTDDLDFGEVAMGETRVLGLTVTNDGTTEFPLESTITAFCDFFTLPNGVPAFVPGGAAVTVDVAFTPVQTREVFCDLTLSPNLPPIRLHGSGFEPVTDWSIMGSGSFGYVNVGDEAMRVVTLRNTGQTTLAINPAFVDSCPDFTLLSGGGARDLLPGQSVDFAVRFAPSVEGYQRCDIDTGHPSIGPILFEGLGKPPVTSWEAPTEYSFLSRYVGIATTAAIIVTNTGSTVIPLHASLPVGCAEFTILQGGGYDVQLQPGQAHGIQVEFLATSQGQFDCVMDLGDVVPDVALYGEAVPAPGSLTVYPNPLVFTNTLVGQYQDRDITIRNMTTYDVSFNPALSEVSGGFWMVAGDTLVTLAPLDVHIITVRFSPSAPIPYEDVLLLGSQHPAAPILGTGVEPDPNCRLEPEALDFGTVNLGQSAELPVTVHNDGDVSLLLEPATDNPAFFIDAPPVLLAPGQSHNFDILFQPTSLGGHGGILEFGNNFCGVVSLAGAAILAPHHFLAEPDTVDIPAVPVNTVVERDVLVTNLSGHVLTLDVQVLAPTFGFSLLDGGGPGELYPGESHLVRLRFQCLTEQTYATNLSFGPGLPLVPIFAEGVVVRPDCELETTEVNFGNALIGGIRYRYVELTNNGDTPLVLDPSVDHPDFAVNVDSLAVAPGSTILVQIAFAPEAVGSYFATASLGNQLCADLNLYAEVVPDGPPGLNQLGIFWDQGWWHNSVTAYQDNQQFTGYLVLSQPSMPGGIAGWECRVDKEGGAFILGWDIEGDHVNLGTDPDFVVGLASPLPYTDQTLLASFQVLVPDRWEVTLFSLNPILRASVPGQMSWVPGGAPELLLRMGTVTGIPLVADINGGSPVAIQLPTPVARLQGRQVDLSWTIDAGAWDGCHVYRRDADEAAAVRLTSAPLSDAEGRLVYTDLADGLTPGRTYFYSYAAVKDGEERGRSPEVAVEMPPYRPLATRLLPNVPNPFNPMTEIRFELGQAQRVDLRIYDVTGRLVRTLVDRELTHGPHAATWQGRDNTGRPVPSGAYYVRLVTNEGVDKRKIMLLK